MIPDYSLSLRLPYPYISAAIFFLALLLPVAGRGQDAGPSVSIKLFLNGTFSGNATVQAPRENSGDDGGLPVLYPSSAADEGVEGTVKLKMLIGADGSIMESEAIDNGGDSRLLKAAVEGLRRAGFAPGSVDGKPTEMRVMMEVKFSAGKPDVPSHPTFDPSEISMPDRLSLEWNSMRIDSSKDFDSYEKPPKYDPAELRKVLVYPKAARENGIEGNVTVSVRIDSTGKPIKVVIRASTNRIFEQSVKDAVLQMTYSPAVMDGKAINAWLTFKVDFKFTDPPVDALATPPEVQKADTSREYGMDEFVRGATDPQYDASQLSDLLEYPKEARENGIEGRVTLSVQVDTDGTPLDIQVRNASNPMFAEYAIKAARQLNYTPGIKDGKPIKMWLTFQVNFRFRD